MLDLQVKPGPFFSVIQIGLNAIAILGGIIGETLFSPFFEELFLYFCSPELASSFRVLLLFLYDYDGFRAVCRLDSQTYRFK